MISIALHQAKDTNEEERAKFQGLSSVFEFMTAAPNKTWQPAGAVFGQLIFHISKSDFRYVPILNRVLAPCLVDTGE